MNRRRECGQHTFINDTPAQQILSLAADAVASEVRIPRAPVT
jgi:hypothetical protein